MLGEYEFAENRSTTINSFLAFQLVDIVILQRPDVFLNILIMSLLALIEIYVINLLFRV